MKTSDSVIGPGQAIRYDEKLTHKLDCETELGIVIGTAERHIPKEHALKHVFGYTIVNDVTARDRQVRRSGILPGTNSDVGELSQNFGDGGVQAATA